MNDKYNPSNPGYVRPRHLCFIDLDGVLADYDTLCLSLGYPLKSGAGKVHPGFYRDIKPFHWAQDMVRNLENFHPGWVRFLTACSVDRPEAWAEKVEWIKTYFPSFQDRLIITRDKSAAGTQWDYLIDDQPQRAGAGQFPGYVIHFNPNGGMAYWDVISFLREELETWEGE